MQGRPSTQMGSAAPLFKFHTSRRQQSTILRVFFLIIIVGICYSTISPSSWLFEILHPSPQNENFHSIPGGVRYFQTPSLQGSNKYSSSSSSTGTNQIDAFTKEEAQASLQRRPLPHLQPTRHGNSPETRDITKAIQAILTLLPDELHIMRLLGPIQGTGEDKIHEIGLRTRLFKTLLEAWEVLHLVPSEGATMYTRDNIIQYLQAEPDIAQSLHMSTAKLIRSYEAYRSLLTRLSTLLFPWISPYFSDHMGFHAHLYSGQQGLVFSAGDAQALYLITTIQSIRQLGCTLPIEVMYLGDEDLSEDYRERLETIPGVITRDLAQMVLEDKWTLQGWAAKPFAILFSSFREAIFIDADAVFLRDPAVLFEDPAYQEQGALFFKDRLMMAESKRKWMQQILPKPVSKKARETRLWTGESSHMQESGVVVVDKWRHFVSLLLVTRLNGPDRDGNKETGEIGVYDMVYGDKETFWLGWELVGDLGYAFHSGDAALLGVARPGKHDAPPDPKNKDPELLKTDIDQGVFTICGPQLLHLDRDGRPLWFNGWLLPNKFSKGLNPEPVDFQEFITESPVVDSPGSWRLTRDNICCMTSETRHELTDDEKDALKMTVDVAREVGAI